nr:MAG TPA: hypothetical protein [Caudoviricetes sp.]
MPAKAPYPAVRIFKSAKGRTGIYLGVLCRAQRGRKGRSG